ncbi:DPP IV N-terminal domain-containing protein [Mycobacterium sp. 21AC1]|uniref:S9 family peptidase n=1 Tax=[Mycobacterium] appelbergii TaxID=2939269 RepID=UPI002938ED1D|nr:DPP IV N-terminal domain-containing protein [Mycobacterium sp. 21AC1]MDV3126368.1 DPP IV N-terminal domain-containing protein [Mycobacterium sp. 21AC1]
MTTILTDSDYARAEQMLAPYRARKVPGCALQPQWLADGTRFWYQVGPRYVVVDPAEGRRQDAFDHDALAAALSVASRHPAAGDDLPISAVEIRDDHTVRFSAFGTRWEWSDGSCVPSEGAAPVPGEVRSPDEQWVAFRRDGNIWVRRCESGEEFALTDDAEPQFDYGGLPDTTGARALMRYLGLPPPMILHWSPDSTRILVQRIDQRDLPDLVLIESSPPGGGRPVEHRTRYTMPGEEAVATMTWNVLDIGKRTVVRQQTEPTPIMHNVALVYAWWTDKDTIHFLHHSRDARTLELRRLDPASGALTTLISETGQTRVDPVVQLGDPQMVRVLDSGEVLWWSQRDGWGHLYLYSADGAQVSQVTSGPWLVRSLLWVDEATRQVWFVANGLVDDDPYLRQICRIGLDGKGFTRLTDDDLDHDAVSPPEGGYLVDRASTSSRPPRSVVLDGDGQLLVELESPGTETLDALGWRPPERFRTTAADGKTSIYGLLWRPHDFDPQRRYPIIEHTYPGPQIYRAGPSFDPPHQGEPEAFAALGFAVVAIDGRGTAARSKAFHDHSYGDLGNAGALDDHVAAIRELGHRYPWLDTGRIGITGQSAGAFAAARAVLMYPDFYRVAVATSGNHDNGVNLAMWAEHYHGDVSAEGKAAISNATLAANLKGKLLLIHGELDDNAHPYMTLRLADALIKADKDFDLIMIPGAEHALIGRQHYFLRRTWDYFVRHLHGSEPPSYRLAPLPLPSLGG